MISLAGFCEAADFHVDASSGRDENSGISPDQAWRTLEKVNASGFRPGDRILFRAGTTCRGQLAPKGSGVEGRPIIVDRYGEGPDPAIEGGGIFDDGGFYGSEGKPGSVVYLLNQSFWEISNLEITNHGKEAGYRRGVRVEITDMGECRHIHLKHLHVHDVNGLNKSRGNSHHELSKQTGGIFLCVTGDDRNTRFSDVLVEGCVVRHCDRSGISVGARKHWYPEWNRLLESGLAEQSLHRNIVIRNNAIEDVGGDGIVVQYALAPVIEYNVCKDAAARSFKDGQYSAGIWPWMCENAVFQFNEVSHTRSRLDGQGFDCDSGRGTIYQFNYSHDNEGGFMLFCQGSSVNSIVRHNISRNDHFALFTNSGGSAIVHNNVFHIGRGLDTNVSFPGAAGKMRIFNNIFLNEGTCRSARWGPYTFEANMYSGFDTVPEDPRRLTGDPGLISPAAAGFRPVLPLADVRRWSDVIDGYRLRPDSPCINRAVLPETPPGGLVHDLWGNPIGQGALDIGAHEYPSPAR